jgi:hypothetical protein
VLNVYELSFFEAILSNVICKIPSGVPYGYCLWRVCTFIQIFLKNFQWKSSLSKLEKFAQYVKALILHIRDSFYFINAVKCTGFSWHMTII